MVCSIGVCVAKVLAIDFITATVQSSQDHITFTQYGVKTLYFPFFLISLGQNHVSFTQHTLNNLSFIFFPFTQIKIKLLRLNMESNISSFSFSLFLQVKIIFLSLNIVKTRIFFSFLSFYLSTKNHLYFASFLFSSVYPWPACYQALHYSLSLPVTATSTALCLLPPAFPPCAMQITKGVTSPPLVTLHIIPRFAFRMYPCMLHHLFPHAPLPPPPTTHALHTADRKSVV